MKEFVRRLSRDPVAIAESSLPSPVVTYLVQERTWRLVAPFELSIAAPLFRDAMEKEGVWAWRRVAAYRDVRWFGSGAWSAGS